MSRFYGIYLKGKPNEPLDLTKLIDFERTGNLRSPKLYTLKELIKLTTKYDSELEFKYALFRSGIIDINDITKDLSIRGIKENNKVGKPKEIVYKPCIDLFRPQVIKELYLNKTDLIKDYEFLKKLIKEFKPYPVSHDIGRYTSEIFLDEINNIMINYDPECFYDEKMKEIMNNFINHEMYFVLGETSPNGYDRKIHYRYRTDKNTNNKIIDLHSLYKLVLFYIHNSNDKRLVTGKATPLELQELKQSIEREIKKRQLDYEKYVREAIQLAEQDMEMLSKYQEENKPKVKKRARKEIVGQIKIEEE